MARLKVYRTPIGFHDAFVAAPSKKAALAAWGATHDLFARGSADVVTDPALTKEPLAAPGVVIRRSRGTASEQLGALPPLKGATRAMSSAASRPVATAPRPPRPDRRQLDLAERAIEELRAAHARQMRRLCDRIAHLERQRAALVSAHRQALAELDAAREQAAARFEQALEKWRG